MIEQPKLRDAYVAGGTTPLDVPRGIAEEKDHFPKGLNDTPVRYRAQSILFDLVQSGVIHDAVLPAEQALDVIAWHERHLRKSPPQVTDRRYALLAFIRPRAPRLPVNPMACAA